MSQTVLHTAYAQDVLYTATHYTANKGEIPHSSGYASFVNEQSP